MMKLSVKTCPICNKTKTRSEFGTDKLGIIRPYCPECMKISQRKYREKYKAIYGVYLGHPTHEKPINYQTIRRTIGDKDAVIQFLTKHINRNKWNDVYIEDRKAFIDCSITKADLKLVRNTDEYKQLIDKILKLEEYPNEVNQE